MYYLDHAPWCKKKTASQVYIGTRKNGSVGNKLKVLMK